MHAFGAYFGIAVALALGPPMSTEDDESTYVTDIFAMIGKLSLEETIFWYFEESKECTSADLGTFPENK